MKRRLAAAVVGALVGLGACVSYSRDVQPRIAGSNTVAPLFAAVNLAPGAETCQPLSHVPAKVNRVRVFTTGVKPAPGKLRVELSDANGVIAEGVNTNVVNATLPVRLGRLTRGAHPARICLSNVGNGRILLGGEEKRVRAAAAPGAKRERLASVVFLRPGSSTWAGRAGIIANRFAGANQGTFGGWSLWAAVIFVISAFGLAFWWLIVRLERGPV